MPLLQWPFPCRLDRHEEMDRHPYRPVSGAWHLCRRRTVSDRACDPSCRDCAGRRALAKQIDFPALRSSLKAQLDDRMVRSAGADMQASPLGAFGLTIAGAVAGTTVDAMVTPTGLGALMQGHILFKRFGDGLSSSEPSSPEPLHDPSYKYESTSRFIATTHDANDRPIVFVLTRHGLQWQLSDIQLPP
jgi:hypothetical protein